MVWLTVTSWLTPSCLFVFLNLTIGAIAVASAFSAGKNHRRRRNPYHIIRDVHTSSPSIIDRVRSFDFSRHRSDPPFSPDESIHTLDSSPPTDPHAPSPFLLRATSFIRSLDFSPQRSDLPPSYSPSPPPPELAGIPNKYSKTEEIEIPNKYSKTEEMEIPNKCTKTEEIEMAESETTPYSFMKRIRSFGLSSGESAGCVREPGFVERMEEKNGVEVKGVECTDRKEREEDGVCRADEGVDKKADDFIHRFRRELLLQRKESLLRSMAEEEKAVPV